MKTIKDRITYSVTDGLTEHSLTVKAKLEVTCSIELSKYESDKARGGVDLVAMAKEQATRKLMREVYGDIADRVHDAQGILAHVNRLDHKEANDSMLTVFEILAGIKKDLQ